ncbi:PHD finger protein [Canna indica]|uniref:PHD finger protein n=1 Tax=Canna indica TaxID=4628 RepID=A0AAQ3KDB6_9LILI|nr:PHD finger protein [Canna indica]
MVVNERPLKRAKRRVTADLCDFLTFPDDGVGGFDAPFRVNVRAFLSRYGRSLAPPPPPSILRSAAVGGDEPHLLIWRVSFRVGGGSEGTPAAAAEVELDVVVEDVPRSKSIYCDQCRVVGWSDHPVCGKRYHFIIRNDKNSLSRSGMSCIRCGTLLSLSSLRCYSCNCEITLDTFEDWAHLQLEDSTHLLHGIVHANGYGHLLRVNGKEGGSKFLTGRDIMSFWDRLCTLLRIRKVSVMDISKKYGMDYRLLHAVTAGHPWYGNWGYKFGTGSFALTAESYQKAVDTLSRVPLSIFFSRARYPRTQLQNTIGLYWSLSDQQLLTVRDLFCCVMHQLQQASSCLTPGNLVLKKSAEAGAICTWTKDEVERAEEVIVKFLRSVDRSRWVTWRALRGAACHAIEPPELLDYCLKGLGGKHVSDELIIVARYNADIKAIEYRIETNSGQATSTRCLPRPSADQLICDLKFLYDALLNPNTMQPYKPTGMRNQALNSAAKLLDCKQFIRHYDEPATSQLPSNPLVITLWCHVELVDHPEDYTAPPLELLVLPTDASVADLKLQVTKTFQETYLVFQRFQAEQLLNYEQISDATHIKTLFGSHGVARIRGRCLGNDKTLGQFRKERGLDNWIVDCACGAKDDDGERMMACDACGVWQHTRCAGIDDFEEVPAKFVCKECVGIRKYNGRGLGRPRNGPSVRCKDEIGSSFSNAGRLGRLTTVG